MQNAIRYSSVDLYVVLIKDKILRLDKRKLIGRYLSKMEAIDMKCGLLKTPEYGDGTKCKVLYNYADKETGKPGKHYIGW